MRRHAHALAVPAVAAVAVAEHAVLCPDEPLHAVVLRHCAALLAVRPQAAAALHADADADADALTRVMCPRISCLTHTIFAGRPPGAQRVDVATVDAAVRDADVDVGCGEGIGGCLAVCGEGVGLRSGRR